MFKISKNKKKYNIHDYEIIFIDECSMIQK
jgi:hypothetical protein